jgi:hypothetical protein
MKGYVKVTNQQLQEAISGFGRKYAAGKAIRDKGIALYYEKHYTKGNWLTRLLNRGKTPMQFVRKQIGLFGSWDEVLHEVLDVEESNTLYWWCFTHPDKANVLKTLRSTSADGLALVDNEMARMIEAWSEYK